MSSSNDSAVQSGKPKEGEEEVQRIDLACVEGVYMPQKKFGKVRLDQHIQDLRGMKLRDDDIFLLAYPKAGTHWMWEVLSMLIRGQADYDARRKVQLMMEFVDLETLDEQPSPRILNTHLPFSMLPVQEMRDKRAKLVHVYRNPKDVVVSMHFMAKTGMMSMGALEFPDFFEFFLTDKAPYCGYFGYLKQMYEFTQANTDVPVIHISYEDMKKNPVPTLLRVAEFLKVPATEQLCQDIADACSFQKMKANEQEKDAIHFGGGDKMGSKASENQGSAVALAHRKPVIFRKGEVGDWKNHLTMAMSEKMDAMIEEKLKGLPFTLRFT